MRAITKITAALAALDQLEEAETNLEQAAIAMRHGRGEAYAAAVQLHNASARAATFHRAAVKMALTVAKGELEELRRELRGRPIALGPKPADDRTVSVAELVAGGEL